MSKIATWPQAMILRDGTPARYIERDERSGRHRIAFARTSSPTIRGDGRQKAPEEDWEMIYTLDDCGVCRVDGVPGSPFDYARPA